MSGWLLKKQLVLPSKGNLVASSLEFHLQSFSDVAQQMLRWTPSLIRWGKPIHLPLCQETRHCPVKPPPAPLDAIGCPANLTFPIQMGQNVWEQEPGSGKYSEDFSQVSLHFPKENNMVAALLTHTFSTEVNYQEVRSRASGPERAHHWKQLLPESASSCSLQMMELPTIHSRCHLKEWGSCDLPPVFMLPWSCGRNGPAYCESPPMLCQSDV